MPLVMFELLPTEGRLKTWLRRVFRRPRRWARVVLPIPPNWKVPHAGQTLVAKRGVPVRLPQEALRVAATAPQKFRYAYRVVTDGAMRNQPCLCGSGKKYKKCGCNNAVRGAAEPRTLDGLVGGKVAP
jgi:hypothetical protein